MTLVSVVIPTYREEDYIRAAVNSIRKQSIQDVEIIIADYDPDGQGLTREAAGAGIVYVAVDKKGIGYARRVGVANSTGKYLVNFDADAVFSTTSDMQKLIDAVNTPGAKYAHCPIIISGKMEDALAGHILVNMLNMAQFVLPQGWEPGLTMTRETYNSVGGFKQDGVMEGAALCTDIAMKYGVFSRRYVTDVKVFVSDRRYRSMDFNFNNAYRQGGRVSVD